MRLAQDAFWRDTNLINELETLLSLSDTSMFWIIYRDDRGNTASRMCELHFSDEFPSVKSRKKRRVVMLETEAEC